MSTTLISPIFYMGNKKKLINKGLINLFPSNINNFYDVFGGSGIVSLNTKCNNIYLNDKDINLYSLYKMFKEYNPDTIINHITNNIKIYGLAQERTKRNIFKDESKLKLYKNAYIQLRNKYNTNKNILDFYNLMFYSFSQQFRFNNKGEFNMPIGNDYFSDKNKEYIIKSTEFWNKVNISNNDFRYILENINNYNKDDFFYLDPPYFNTIAVYNENNGWTDNDENTLLLICETLNNNSIRFGLSNIFEHKGIKNDRLIEWVKKNNFNVFYFDKVSYQACGKGNFDVKEVYICNY